MGAAVKASILENVMMTHHRLNPQFTRWKGLLLNDQYARKFTEQIEQQFSVVMDQSTPFVLLDQPTRGLDVGSIEYVHELILEMRDQNRAILLISADLEELFRIADRILVLHRGKIVADLPTDQTDIEEVGYLMLEGKENDAKETD